MVAQYGRSKRKRALNYLLYFGAIFVWGAFTLWIHLSTSSPVGDLVLSAPRALIERFGVGDAGSYLTLAVDLSNGQVRPENVWILNLWPPGMAILETFLLWLPGPILPKIAVASVGIWAAAGAAIAVTLQRRGSIWLAVGFVIAWAVTAPAMGWVFSVGFAYSDGIGASWVALSLLCSFLGLEALKDNGQLRRSGFLWLLAGGVFAGLSLHFRWALAGAVAGLAFYAIALGVVFLAVQLARNATRVKRRPSSIEQPISGIRSAAAFTLALGILIPVGPWTAFVYTVLHPGNPTWSAGEYQWAQRWLTDSQLRDAQFLADGNANWACEISPVACKDQFNEIALSANAGDYGFLRNAALRQIVSNPIGFAQNRADVFFRGWFSTPNEGVGTFGGVPSGIAYLVALAALIALSVLLFRRHWIFIGGVWVALSGMIAVISVAHLEVRYLINIQITLLIATSLLLTWTGWKFVSKRETQISKNSKGAIEISATSAPTGDGELVRAEN